MTLPVETLALILIALVLVVGLALLRLELKVRRLTRGADGKSLEAAIGGLGQAIVDLRKFEEESKGYFKNLEKRVRRSNQAIETVRFNAFKGDGLGGNQSFATAMLDEKGDGVVISSLYSRERVSVFAKGIVGFKPQINLSEEETQAVSSAQAKLAAK
ncbi:MAG: DUF4446 family protein [Candidatus Paceibacterota bacterium]|jgi:hypothetical protein